MALRFFLVIHVLKSSLENYVSFWKTKDLINILQKGDIRDKSNLKTLILLISILVAKKLNYLKARFNDLNKTLKYEVHLYSKFISKI